MNDLSIPDRPLEIDEGRLLTAALDPDTRLSPLDRLSLRLGVWLLLRGARRLARRQAPARDHAADGALERARLERELRDAWARVSHQHFH